MVFILIFGTSLGRPEEGGPLAARSPPVNLAGMKQAATERQHLRSNKCHVDDLKLEG
jgi:hypothetical protein